MEHELIEMLRRVTDALQRTANPRGKLDTDLVAEARALLERAQRQAAQAKEEAGRNTTWDSSRKP